MSDIFLGALVVPAAIYGLVQYCRTGRTAPIGEAFRWGRRQWLRTLGNKLKVEVTVTLWGALLFIPGIVAMIRLIFTDVIVAIEADRQPDPLNRSRELSHGHRWRIFFVLLPLTILDLAGMFFVLDRNQGVVNSRLLFAIAESLLAVPGQLSNRDSANLSRAGSEIRDETEAVTLKAERIVKAMRVGALEVAGEGKLVASGAAALGASVLHHGAPDSPPLQRRQHRDIFHHARRRAALTQLIHDQQRVRAADFTVHRRHQQAEVRPLSNSRIVLARFFESERMPAIDSRFGKHAQHSRQVLLFSVADLNRSHVPFVAQCSHR